LRDAHGVSSTFYLYEDESGAALIERKGFALVRLRAAGAELVPAGDALIVVDVPGGVSRQAVEALRRRDSRRLVVLFDGMCPGRLDADLVVSPMARKTEASDWQGFHGRRFEGPPFAIVDRAYGGLPVRRIDSARPPRLLVSMGGADPYGLTLQALRAIDAMPGIFETVVALGPAYSQEPELKAWLGEARRPYELRRDALLVPAMLRADLAVTSFGTTVYELAAAGLPAIALCITPDHVEAAALFARNGTLISAGLYSSVAPQVLVNMVHELLADPRRRMQMARAGQALVDGVGARRVADLLVDAINRQRG